LLCLSSSKVVAYLQWVLKKAFVLVQSYIFVETDLRHGGTQSFGLIKKVTRIQFGTTTKKFSKSY